MADGSQLRRRVRMATADEPVDADSIANQAASELRQQIEASPIGERLDRVVQEDRPLASRVASAETPLVPEPDDSPSAREVSFHLPEPTGRGAVRSALRTPGIAADLRPRTPFGEEETGIAPEPELSAKPEAADVEVMEPRQEDQSPASPEHDALAQNAATDELEDLHKAQRRDRRMAIAGGVLRGVQALAGMIGGAVGIPGLAGLGGMAGVASGLIPQGRATEQFNEEHALRREQERDAVQAEQRAYDRSRGEAADDATAKRLEAYMQQTQAATGNTQARIDRQRMLDEQMQRETEADRRAAITSLRMAINNHRRAVPGAAPDAFQDLIDSVDDSTSPDAVREMAEQVDDYTNRQVAAQRTSGVRRSGGGGGGSSASTAALRQQLIEAGADPESVNNLSPRQVRAMEQQRQQQRIAQAARNGQAGAEGQPAVDQRQYAQYEAQRRPLYVREASLLRLQGTLNQLRQNNPATFAAALTDSRAFNNASSEAAVVRSQINRAVAAYLNKISGAGVSEGEFERTMRNTGAHNVINPQVLFSFIGDELSNTRDSRDSLATRGGGAFEREFARQLAAQRAARQPQGGRQ